MAKGKKWELVLKEVESLIGHSNGVLFDRVLKLQSVYDDPAFRLHHKEVEDDIHDHLDKFLGDYGISFADASLMLRYYPAKSQWEFGKVREMLAESMDRRDAERPQAAAPRKRSVVSHKEFEQVQKQVEQETVRSKALASELADKRTELEQLREENKRLTRELARAEGRISELERMVKGELAAA